MLNQLLLVGSLVADGILLLMLFPFMCLHLRMAFMNETTIEGVAPACSPPCSARAADGMELAARGGGEAVCGQTPGAGGGGG